MEDICDTWTQKSRNLPIVGNLFDKIDSYVDGCLSDLDNIMEKFTKDWWKLWNKLKKVMGTSAGFTWLPEYLIFQTIKRYLENELKSKFLEQKQNKTKVVVCDFVLNYHGKEIVLGHNAIYDEYKEGKRSPRPDIILRINNKTIVIFEVKVGMDKNIIEHTSKSLEKLLKKCDWLKDPKVYIVYFSEKLWTKDSKAKYQLNLLFNKGVKFIACNKFWEDNKERKMLPKQSKISLKEALEEVLKIIKEVEMLKV